VLEKAVALPPADNVRTAFGRVEIPGKKVGATQAVESDLPCPLNITVAHIGEIALSVSAGMLTEVGKAIKGPPRTGRRSS